MSQKLAKPKFIFVVGGVMSGVGKGTATASLGLLLKRRGFAVTAIKADPYINVDAGTMNPIEHGEVFVTEDGDETDQDIGSYERFLDTTILSANYMTTGRVYQSVIERERALGYGGRCVEVVPHIPEEIIRRIKLAQKKSKADVVMIEIGGTVGEYQNILFLEAARMLKLELNGDVLFVLVSYLPIPGRLGEMKTKPTQYASRTLNNTGIQADFIVGRATEPIDEPRKKKMAMLCNVPEDCIISGPDMKSVYRVPVMFEEEHFAEKVMKKLSLQSRSAKGVQEWFKWANEVREYEKEVRIGVIGKYFTTGHFMLSDAYFSVVEALKHAAWASKRKPILEWIDSEKFEADPKAVKELEKYDGIVVPGGFGKRGVEGIILAIKYAREHKIPYLGLCYGMQLAVIEYARHVLKLKDAHTTEINKQTPYPIIDIMPEQLSNLEKAHYGGSMRLGAYPAVLDKSSIAYASYSAAVEGRWHFVDKQKATVRERHRHRYEVSPVYVDQLRKAGMNFSGTSPNGVLMEIMELPKRTHPFFLGTQFHPEYTSGPLCPHPLFDAFLKAAIKHGKNR